MRKNRILAAVLAVLLLLSLTACAAKSASSGYAAYENAYDAAAPMAPAEGIYDAGSGNSALPEVSNRKLIKTVRMEAETQDLDVLLGQLDEQVALLGGYMEERNVRNGGTYSGSSYRYANLTIRIPASMADSFIAKVEDYSNITSSSQSVEDITLQYVAVQSRVDALEAEQARLLELMEQAENMAELLDIEARLTDVRYELEYVASQMRTYDNLVDYATIHLSISQVRELTPPEPEGFFSRIGNGFVENLKDVGHGIVEVFIWFITGIPYFVVLGIIAAVIVIVCRKLPKRKKKQKDTPAE